MHRNQRADDHQRFRELAALAQAHALADGERLELENHLRQCAVCHEAYGEYSLLHTQGMAELAVAGDQSSEFEGWESRSVGNEFLEQVRAGERRRNGLVES